MSSRPPATPPATAPVRAAAKGPAATMGPMPGIASGADARQKAGHAAKGAAPGRAVAGFTHAHSLIFRRLHLRALSLAFAPFVFGCDTDLLLKALVPQGLDRLFSAFPVRKDAYDVRQEYPLPSVILGPRPRSPGHV